MMNNGHCIINTKDNSEFIRITLDYKIVKHLRHGNTMKLTYNIDDRTKKEIDKLFG